ncbi:MAG: PQQ-binding-like beta-propeller repeat protein [Candidatus Marinimicrobia bacterium]|nr:PQQ-binding-like beta-propeller repeat protein [Candidatus Neomarinimicrobiota bacterium]
MLLLIRSLLSIILTATVVWSQTTDSTTISFAWLTDTHVGASTGYDDLHSVTRDISQDGSISFAIVSGDVSEMDVGQNLMLAKSLLDSMNIPYLIIPGNHDTKWSSSGGERFEQIWGADRFNKEIGEFRFIGIHQGPMLRMGDGYIDPADITWVDSILQALPDPRQKIFIVQHYPLDPSVDNWYAFMDVIVPYNIQAVLHGHGHGNRVTSFEGIPGIMSRSTLRRKQDSSGYTLVRLQDNQADFYEKSLATDSLELWHSLPLGNHDYRDSLRLPLPDYSHNETSGVTLAWQTSVGSLITSNPTLHDNTVFVSTMSGAVIALDISNGQPTWNWQGQGAIHSTPAIRGDRLIVGSVDSTITCLSGSDGKLKWQIKTTGSVLGSPLIHKNRVYIGSGDGVFRCLNLRNGKVKWAYPEIGGYIETRPIMAEDKIMFGAWDGSFYALHAKRGELLWKWSDGRSGLLYSPAACWPVSAHGKVFVVAPDRAMTAIDNANGETVWRKTGHKVREMIGISEDGETIFARTMQDSVFAINSASDEFELKWDRHVGFGYDFNAAAMVEQDGRLYFSTKDGWVYCLDSSTGELLWHYRVSDGLVNAVEPVNGNAVLTTAADGKVSLLSF